MFDLRDWVYLGPEAKPGENYENLWRTITSLTHKPKKKKNWRQKKNNIINVIQFKDVGKEGGGNLRTFKQT